MSNKSQFGSSGDCSSLSYLFHLALHKNNVGVDFYNLGYHEAAIQSLYCSLSYMQQFSKYEEQRHFERTEAEYMRVSHEYASLTAIMDPYTNHGGDTGLQDQQSHPTETCGDMADKDRNRIDLTPPLMHVSSDETSLDCGRDCAQTVSTNIADENKSKDFATTTVNLRESNGNVIAIHIDAIYRSAIYLRCHGDCSCSSSDVARIRASILFNLGLAHHMIISGFVMVTSSSVTANANETAQGAVAITLEKAAVLYKLSLNLQVSKQAPISTTYLMALYNNIGECYASLNQKSKSNTWKERLLRLLVCQQQQHQQPQPQSHKQYDCFIQNTMSLILVDPCLSPAA